MVADVTATVVTAKVALAVAAAMVTLEGTTATAELLLDSETTAPPAGAGPFNATVPVDCDPPVTLVGFNMSEVRLGPDCAGVTVSKALCCTPA